MLADGIRFHTVFGFQLSEEKQSCIASNAEADSGNRNARSDNAISQPVVIRGVVEIWSNICRSSESRPVKSSLLELVRKGREVCHCYRSAKEGDDFLLRLGCGFSWDLVFYEIQRGNNRDRLTRAQMLTIRLSRCRISDTL